MLYVSGKASLKIIGDLLFTVITIVFAILAVFFVIIKLLDWSLLTIDSPSMAPKYPTNSLIIVRKIEPENIQEGDVIAFVLNEDGFIATHRVVAVNKENKTFTTKGDANSSIDVAPVQWENIVGKVVFGIPWLGKPMRSLTAEKNRPIVITCIVILFLCSLVWDIHAKKNRRAH